MLVGYVFFAIAMWYLCGDLARPYQKALLELPQSSPIMVIVYLVLGWLFILLSQYKSIQYVKEKETQNG
jgi:NhaP-type Na+/H+ or K+/H+ antiporter